MCAVIKCYAHSSVGITAGFWMQSNVVPMVAKACSVKALFWNFADLCRLVDLVYQQGDLHHKPWRLVHDWDPITGQCTVQ